MEPVILTMFAIFVYGMNRQNMTPVSDQMLRAHQSTQRRMTKSPTRIEKKQNGVPSDIGVNNFQQTELYFWHKNKQTEHTTEVE